MLLGRQGRRMLRSEGGVDDDGDDDDDEDDDVDDDDGIIGWVYLI